MNRKRVQIDMIASLLRMNPHAIREGEVVILVSNHERVDPYERMLHTKNTRGKSKNPNTKSIKQQSKTHTYHKQRKTR